MGETALAVDFGTSSTAAAYRDASGHSRKVQLSADGFLMPSAVYYAGGVVQVGRSAVQAATANAEAFEPWPKRRLGEKDTVLAGQNVPTSRLIAAVLSDVLDRAQRVMGSAPGNVILTHPDSWTAAQRELFVAAGVEAGLDRARIRLVSEATSAGWYYTVAAARLPVGARLAVVDFGAGRCDVAVLDKRRDETFAVTAVDGLPDLGGRDLDARIDAWVTERISDGDGSSTDDSAGARLTLGDRIREAKEALSEAASAPIVVAGSDNQVLELTRDEFERLIAPDVDRVVALLQGVLDDAEKHGSASAPVTIYLTGGSSAIPLVRTRLASLGPVNLLGDPKTVVAQGALLAPSGDGLVVGADEDTVVNNAREKQAIVAARSSAAIPAVQPPAAGWYPDPRNPRASRYWTGTAWGPGPQQAPRRPEPAAPNPARPVPNTPRPAANVPRPLPPQHRGPSGPVAPESPTKPVEPPNARTQTGIPLKFADPANQTPAPFAETQEAALPIFPRSNPALSAPGMSAQPPSTTPSEQAKLPDKPTGRPGLTDRLPPVVQALISAALLIPTAGLLLAFQSAGTASDFTVLWQWQVPSTAWFVAPYLYLAAAILVFGRTPRARRNGVLVALGALAFHMACSAALATVDNSTMYLRLVYGVAGVIALCAWAIARRTHRSWLVGLVLAAPAVIGIRYLDEMVTVNNIAWIAVWIQYFGSFAIGSVVLWAASALGAPQTAKQVKRRRR